MDKYETSKAFKENRVTQQRPQFSMNKITNPITKDYYDEMDFRKRDEIHQAVTELSEKGIIEVKWSKYKHGEEIEKIYLNYDQVDKAYEKTGIVPKQQKLQTIRRILTPLQEHPWDWVRLFWQHYDDSLSRNHTAGLDINEPKGHEDLVKTLLHLPTMKEGTTKRVLSHSLFHDTKYFEKNVQSRLLSIYKRFGNNEMETDIEYLDAIGIVDTPKLTRISGPLVFICNGVTTNISGLPGGIGLTFETISNLEIIQISAKRIILIENLTAYNEFLSGSVKEEVEELHISGNPTDNLVIYTGGFPHHALRKLLLKLKNFLEEQNSNIKVFHWGDIDYGGILIYEHLRNNYFPKLEPLFMNVYIYQKHCDYGLEFTPGYEEKLVLLLENKSYMHWKSLIEAIIKNKKRLEQESLLINWW